MAQLAYVMLKDKSSDPGTTQVHTFQVIHAWSGWIRHHDDIAGRSTTFYMDGPEKDYGIGIYPESLTYWDPRQEREPISESERTRILGELVDAYSRLIPDCRLVLHPCIVDYGRDTLHVVDFKTGRSLTVSYDAVKGRDEPGLKAGNVLHLQPFTRWDPPNQNVPVTDVDRQRIFRYLVDRNFRLSRSAGYASYIEGWQSVQ